MAPTLKLKPATDGAVIARRWPNHLLARVKKLRQRIDQHKLDALLVTFPHDIRYLSGFCGEDAWALVSDRDLAIFSDRRYEEELTRQNAFARIVIRKKTTLAEELGKLVRARRLRTIGVQAEHLTLAQRKGVAKHLGGVRLRSTLGWLVEQRAVKDEHEIVLLERAVAIQERAFRRTVHDVRPGMTERQVTGILVGHMWRLGADGPAFDPIVAAGPTSSRPHYSPGEPRVALREPLLIDWGALVQGYHGDSTRVVFYGGVPRQFRQIHSLVREAHQAAIEAIAPGKKLKDIDAIARGVIRRGGFGKQFSHSLGHGIGLEIHELPRLMAKATGELVPGHVVTVEPGIYLPGIGGIRLEDDVLVTQTGRRVLGALPTDLEPSAY